MSSRPSCSQVLGVQRLQMLANLLQPETPGCFHFRAVNPTGGDPTSKSPIVGWNHRPPVRGKTVTPVPRYHGWKRASAGEHDVFH